MDTYKVLMDTYIKFKWAHVKFKWTQIKFKWTQPFVCVDYSTLKINGVQYLAKFKINIDFYPPSG